MRNYRITTDTGDNHIVQASNAAQALDDCISLYGACEGVELLEADGTAGDIGNAQYQAIIEIEEQLLQITALVKEHVDRIEALDLSTADEAIAGHLTTAAALLEPITDHIKYGLDLDSIYE